MSDSTSDDDSDSSADNPYRIKMRAGELEVVAESETESVEELSELCSGELEKMMRYHIRGEMEMIEEQDLHAVLFGE